MIDTGKNQRTKPATVLGISVAVGALLVLTMLPVLTSAVQPGRQAVLTPADATCATGAAPVIPGYDPVTHEIYVPNEGGSISVFKGTCTLVGTISLASGAEPWQAAFDPGNNYMYVTDYGLNAVYEISGTKIVATITGFDGPQGITYDQFWNLMLVVNSRNDQVYYISGTSWTQFFYTGSDPYEIVYDPAMASDLVTNIGSDNVTIFNSRTTVVTSVDVGASPEGIAFDRANACDYVANRGSNNVMLLCGGFLTDTISGFDQPDAVAWDQATLHIDVTNVGNGEVYEIGGPSDTAIVKKVSTASDSGASGVAYDEFDDKTYVAGYYTDVVYVIS